MSLNVEQIPKRIGYYLAGFADGEGSFNVVFRKRKDYAMPWKVSVCFNVSQRGKSALLLFKEHLRCGTMRQRADGIWYYEVNSLTDATEHVVPFFERFGFLSDKKKRDFAKFEQITRLMNRKQHLCPKGIRRILEIRSAMNDGGAGRRKYSDTEILNEFE